MKMKILHIEDEILFIKEIKEIFEKQKQVQIQNVKRNDDAIKALSENEYDLIILDGNLLDGKSTVVIDHLIKINYDLSKVIIHSGDITFRIDTKKKGFTKIYRKYDSLINELTRYM